MKLGNSRGKNRGKKYLMRSKMVLESTPKTEAKVKNFNNWFVENYTRIEKQLIAKNMYNVDHMHGTYLRMYESLLYRDAEIADYGSYYFRAYYTNMIQERVYNNRYVDADWHLEKVADVPYDAQYEESLKHLGNDVLDYVYKHYKLRDFEIFKLYVSLKPAINYEGLSGITKLRMHTIQHTVSMIKKDVRKSVFAKRKYELMGR